MPNAEYIEWQEFYGIEPFGLSVQDGFNAHHMSLLANANRNAEHRPEPFVIKDFLLFPDKEPDAAPEVAPTVNGLTAEQWKMLLFFQSLQRKRNHVAKSEQTDESNPDRVGIGSDLATDERRAGNQAGAAD